MTLAAGVALTVGLTTGATGPAAQAAPAQRAEAANAVAAAPPPAWHATTSRGGKIRKCYRTSCTAVIGTYAGEAIHWSKYANSPEGRRWYYVRDSIGEKGWMDCRHVRAGC
ncbi:hypothetical protein [Streptomyces sp. NPDC014894]